MPWFCRSQSVPCLQNPVQITIIQCNVTVLGGARSCGRIILDRCCSYCTEPDVFEKLRLFHCKLIAIANFPAVTSNVFHCILHHFSIYIYMNICLLPNAPTEVNKRHRAELHSLLVKLKGMHGLHFIRCFRPNKDGLARGVAADWSFRSNNYVEYGAGSVLIRFDTNIKGYNMI